MDSNILKLFFCLFILASCGTAELFVNKSSIEPTITTSKKADLTEDELNSWSHLDIIADTILGMSLKKAYVELLTDKPSSTVIVGVIDSGVDINHEDLKDVIWINPNEIPNNNIDDDQNGYVDDIHGWNFLGNVVHENLEMTRIIKKGDTLSELYARAKKKYDDKLAEAKSSHNYYSNIWNKLSVIDSMLRSQTNKDDLTLEEVETFRSSNQNQELNNDLDIAIQMLHHISPLSQLKSEIEGGIEYFDAQLKYHLNLDYSERDLVDEYPDDFSKISYGDNNVVGPNLEEATHGTHVAGIIAAKRNNNIGMNGIANNVEILVARAVPDGDEYDKDVSLAIRYAVDNGAKVINTSFGKGFSPHSHEVKKAIVYAAENDVLIVNAAGNDSDNIDVIDTFPNDNAPEGGEVADNFITIGALNHSLDQNLIAIFSNYGKSGVDLFAPGVEIWSTVPENKYKRLDGTSMASPETAGVAALIRSYFPKLKAPQVKKILMQSGIVYQGDVSILQKDKIETSNKAQKISDISRSGKILNAYNALILADKVNASKIVLDE